MRNIEKKVWLGLLSMVGFIAPFSNYANALDNNLLTKQSLEVAPAPQGAFLVSKDKVLKKYENAHKLTDEQLVELLNSQIVCLCL